MTSSAPPKASISPGDRIPTPQKLAFATGVSMDFLATNLMTGVLWMPFFNIGQGMSPAVLGLIFMILRAWDAITDPVVGNLSDNARTRWGRRRPFMFVGAIVTALLYPLFWHMPAGYDGTAKALYLTGVGILFFTSFSLWSMPYYGMQLELTPNYDERTRLTAWCAFFGKLSSLAGGWILALAVQVGQLAQDNAASAASTGAFARTVGWLRPMVAAVASPLPGERPIVTGMRFCGWLIALGIFIFGLLPALFARERYYRKETSHQARNPFLGSLRESLRCRPLWILIGVSSLLVLGTTAAAGLGQYLNFYYVNEGALDRGTIIAGWKNTVIVFSGILAIPFFTWLGERLDKKAVVTTMLAISMGGHLLNYFCMTPRYPYLQIFPGVFESTAIAAVWLFLPSMKADVADWDELHTSRRREGSINAFYSWFIKIAGTLAMGLGGLVIQCSGFNAEAHVQSEAALSRMMALYLALPVTIWTAALFVIWRYPLTRARSHEIRMALEARRGAL